MMHFYHRTPLRRAVLSLILGLTLVYTAALGQDHRDWAHNLGIYEVNVRQYTEEGTFSAFEAHLDGLRDMGAGILWFMPIHPIGLKNRLGSLGSYYSVRDYLDVNPEFGTLDEFKSLVTRIHDRGMAVIIDWVANHTAWDNGLTVTHPEWYVHDGEGRFIAPPGTNWSDVIELDYSNPALREFMIESMKFWVTETGIDGFRCDAVDKVPKDFWQRAIAELKTLKPGLFMLAEGDGRQWHDAGFDMTYGWGLYGFKSGVLKRIADGTNTATNLNTYAAGERTAYPAEACRMYFTSNHDENSWQGTTRELFGEAADAFAVLTATFNGMPLIYSGQEAGLDKRLRFFDKDTIEWRGHANADLYSKLLHLKRKNRALWNGGMGGPLARVSTSDNVSVFAYIREKDGDRVLAVLNLSDQERTVTLNGTSFAGSYVNTFTGESASLASGAVLTLPAWGYEVYEAAGTDPVMTGGTRPDAFALSLNYPNPFNSSTRISYSLDRPCKVRLTLHDSLGKQLRILDSGLKPAGGHAFALSAGELPSGAYLVRLQAEGRVETIRLSLIR
jgi:cyclomaltodextrinase / maltogenic alpha-amylase / neopullulanase